MKMKLAKYSYLQIVCRNWNEDVDANWSMFNVLLLDAVWVTPNTWQSQIVGIENEVYCSLFISVSSCSLNVLLHSKWMYSIVVVSKCQKIHMWFHLNWKINEILMTITMTTTMQRSAKLKLEWNKIVSACVRGTSEQTNEWTNEYAHYRNSASERLCVCVCCLSQTAKRRNENLITFYL